MNVSVREVGKGRAIGGCSPPYLLFCTYEGKYSPHYKTDMQVVNILLIKVVDIACNTSSLYRSW
jgi:hypothetical protein